MVQNEKVIKCDKLGLVFNRVQGNEDILEKYAKEMDLEVFGYIPADENIAYFDLVGKSILGLSTSPGVTAVRSIMEKHIFSERFN
jgi:CO dehydrogenase nickel-insertion accessory protein CooC1